MLVIAHKNCWDGMASAWVIHHKYRNSEIKPRFEFVDYHEPFPKFYPGEDILIVDMSFPGDVLKAVCKTANYVAVLDHHKTAIEELDTFFTQNRQPPNLDLRLRIERSGVGLTWQYVYPDKDIPPLLACVEDRDLWRFKIEHTKAVMAYVGMFPNTFETFDALMDKDFDEILEIGAALHLRNLELVNWHIENSVRMVEFAGYTVPMMNGPRILRSELGDGMLNNDHNYPFAIVYADLADARYFSLRSIKDKGIDVEELAKKYGGGGHKHAAGITAPIDTPITALNPV